MLTEVRQGEGEVGWGLVTACKWQKQMEADTIKAVWDYVLPMSNDARQ